MLPRAIAEFRSIVIWRAEHHSSAQAGRYLIGIEAAIAGLANHPEQHLPAIEADNFPFEVRELHYGVQHGKTTAECSPCVKTSCASIFRAL